jgi:hypothetical protein
MRTLMCCIDFAMCRPICTFPHPLSCVKHQAGYWVMNPPAFCQVYFHVGIANSRVFWLHICLGIWVVLGIFYKLLFLFHTVGVCTQFSDAQSSLGSFFIWGIPWKVVHWMFYKARNYCSRHCLLKMHGCCCYIFHWHWPKMFTQTHDNLYRENCL